MDLENQRSVFFATPSSVNKNVSSYIHMLSYEYARDQLKKTNQNKRNSCMLAENRKYQLYPIVSYDFKSKTKSKNYATLDFLVFTDKNMVPKKCYFGVLSTLV